MFEYRQVLTRMRLGDTDRAIARTGLMGRRKAAQLRLTAELVRRRYALARRRRACRAPGFGTHTARGGLAGGAASRADHALQASGTFVSSNTSGSLAMAAPCQASIGSLPLPFICFHMSRRVRVSSWRSRRVSCCRTEVSTSPRCAPQLHRGSPNDRQPIPRLAVVSAFARRSSTLERAAVMVMFPRRKCTKPVIQAMKATLNPLLNQPRVNTFGRLTPVTSSGARTAGSPA